MAQSLDYAIYNSCCQNPTEFTFLFFSTVPAFAGQDSFTPDVIPGTPREGDILYPLVGFDIGTYLFRIDPNAQGVQSPDNALINVYTAYPTGTYRRSVPAPLQIWRENSTLQPTWVFVDTFPQRGEAWDTLAATNCQRITMLPGAGLSYSVRQFNQDFNARFA